MGSQPAFQVQTAMQLHGHRRWVRPWEVGLLPTVEGVLMNTSLRHWGEKREFRAFKSLQFRDRTISSIMNVNQVSLSLSRSSRTWDQCVDGDDTTLQSDIQAPLQRLRSNTRHSGLPQTTGFLWGKWSLGLWGSSTTGFGCTPFSDQPTSQFFSLQWPEVSKTTWTPGATMEPTQTKIATHSGRPPCKRSLSFQRWSHSAGRHGPGIWHMAMDSEHMGYPQCPMVFHNYDH